MDFGSYLKSLIGKRGYSYRKLATLADIDHTYISKIVVGKMGPPSPEILKKLAGPLGVPYETLMNAAGYLSTDNNDPDADLQPTPRDRIKIFQKKLGELSPESLDFLEFQLNRLHELDLEVIERKKAEREKQRDKSK